MRVLLLIAAVAQVALAGSQFSVRMPFLNPAGVTYVQGPTHSGLAAGPAIGYAGPGVGYAGPGVGFAGPGVGYAGPGVGVGYAGPGVGVGYAGAAVGYAAPTVSTHYGYAAQAVAAPVVHHAAGPVAYGAPAAYAAPAVGYAHTAYAAPAVGYAHAKVPAVAEVPTVHHVQGVADVPYTRVQANHGVIQKLVDVAHPATATRKFEVRRPAIQKQFYDIEERVIVRNAGSALVELDEPLSKAQKGPTVIARHGAVLAPIQPVFVGSTPAPQLLLQPTPSPFVPVASPQPTFIDNNPPQGAFQPDGQSPFVGGPTPPPLGPAPAPPSFDGFEGDVDSVVVENNDFAARSRAAGPNQSQQRFQQQQQQINSQQQELQARQSQLNSEIQQEQDFQSRRQFQGPQQQEQNYARTATEARQGPFPRPQPFSFGAGPSVDVRSRGAPQDLIPQARAGPSVVPSLRGSPEVNQANQQRLIQLLTAQGGVTEVGQGRSGPAGAPIGDLGPVRARVLSATPAPRQSEPAGERVSTRRVVVSRPIETVQEFDVVEPATKVERVAVNHPTVYKTVHHEVARVPTSYPVYGKALAHTYADAAVPVGLGLGLVHH